MSPNEIGRSTGYLRRVLIDGIGLAAYCGDAVTLPLTALPVDFRYVQSRPGQVYWPMPSSQPETTPEMEPGGQPGAAEAGNSAQTKLAATLPQSAAPGTAANVARITQPPAAAACRAAPSSQAETTPETEPAGQRSAVEAGKVPLKPTVVDIPGLSETHDDGPGSTARPLTGKSIEGLASLNGHPKRGGRAQADTAKDPIQQTALRIPEVTAAHSAGRGVKLERLADDGADEPEKSYLAASSSGEGRSGASTSDTLRATAVSLKSSMNPSAGDTHETQAADPPDDPLSVGVTGRRGAGKAHPPVANALQPALHPTGERPSSQGAVENVEQLRRTVQALAARLTAQEAPASDQRNISESLPACPPQLPARPVVLVRPSPGSAGVRHAFWERSYLGRTSLRVRR